MASTPITVPAAGTPGSQPLSARTPNHSSATVPMPTTTSTPHANSQDPDQSLQSSFAVMTSEPADLTIPQAKPFPPASTFTFLPDLYRLISRLRMLEGTPQFTGSGATGSRAGTSSPLLSRDSGTGTAPTTTTNTSSRAADEKAQVEALDLKDLPEHVWEIRQAIQNARDVVAGLPDIQRTTREQDIEIDLLKRQIGGLRKRAGELGVLAKSEDNLNDVKTEDAVMQGVEGVS